MICNPIEESDELPFDDPTGVLGPESSLRPLPFIDHNKKVCYKNVTEGFLNSRESRASRRVDDCDYLVGGFKTNTGTAKKFVIDWFKK